MVDVDSVVTDFAVRDVVEPVDQIGDGGFARTRSAYKSNFLTRFREQAYIVEHLFLRSVSEVHILQAHVAFYFYILGFRVTRSHTFPGPHLRIPVGLFEAAVGFFYHVHQVHVALVFLRLFIDEPEHPARTG